MAGSAARSGWEKGEHCVNIMMVLDGVDEDMGGIYAWDAEQVAMFANYVFHLLRSDFVVARKVMDKA